MSFKLNPLIRDRRKLDYYELVPNPLLFKGKIDVNSDFPTLAEVQTGWFYTIGTDVTDNDATKTNTGLSFVAGDEIAWDGTTWITLGNLDLYDARYLRVNGSNSDDTTGDFDFFKNVAYADDEAGNKIKLYRNVATERDSSLSIYCETDEDWQIHSDWDLDITADALMDITADSLSIDATIGYFKIVPSASVDVSLFSDTDVDNDVDGKTFSIWRKAAEGDTEIQIYADAIEASHITTNANFHIHPTVDNLLLYAEGGQVILQPYAQGDVELFNITDVADASDGKSLYIHRKASEGDTYFQIYGDDDAATGVISFSGGTISFSDENLITTGTISVGADTDIYSTLGRAWVGYNGNAPHADAAGFGHLDHRSGTNYGFLQNAAGKTTINAAPGEDVEIRINNVAEYDFEGHQLQCYSNSIVGVTNFTLGGTLTDGTASLVGGSLTDVKLGSLTTNGFVKTTGADGTLSVDTSTYLTTGDASTIYVPYSGATGNVDLGVHNLSLRTLNFSFSLQGVSATAFSPQIVLTNSSGSSLIVAIGDELVISGNNGLVCTGVKPSSDNTSDLGSATTEWKDLYVDGTGYIDTISADSIQVTGNITVGDGSTVGATTYNWLFDETNGDISTTASVGIGTTTPTYDLDVQTSSANAFYVVQGGGSRYLKFGNSGFINNTTLAVSKTSWAGIASLEMSTVVAGRTGLLIDGKSGQTADLIRCRNSTPIDIFTVGPTGGGYFADKVSFTQTDGNEYIDSLADGYMDYGATTGHRFNNTIDITTTTDPQLRLTHTDGSYETDFYTNSDGELVIMPTARTIYLGDGTAGDGTFGFYGNTSVYTLIHDDSEGTLDLSANSATNFSRFEADGTLEFNGTATVWRDINMGAAQLSRPTSSQPDLVNFVDEAGADTGIQTYAFAVGEKVHGSFELQHDYKEGSDFTFYVHFQGITNPAGTKNVRWRLTYTFAADDATLDAVTIIDSADTPFDTQYEFLRSDIVVISGTNRAIGQQMLFTLERVASTGTAYAGDALIATAGIHYETDTCGSRQIINK